MKKSAKTKKRNAFYEELKAGLEEALRYAKGEGDLSGFKVHIPNIDGKAIRESTGLTQQVFALRYGFTLARLRNLEQKRTKPDSVVRAYLLVIRSDPAAVRAALNT